MFIFQAVIKRLEQECDMASGNIEHLEEERDALRDRLKVFRDYLLYVTNVEGIKFQYISNISAELV
jgi:hypothetical protein